MPFTAGVISTNSKTPKTFLIYKKEYRLKNRDKVKEWNKKNNSKYNHLTRTRDRILSETFLGSECMICGSEENVEFHQVDNKRHTTKKYYKFVGDFIPLCNAHHKTAHYVGAVYPQYNEGVN